jgi:hypothetical protein
MLRSQSKSKYDPWCRMPDLWWLQARDGDSDKECPAFTGCYMRKLMGCLHTRDKDTGRHYKYIRRWHIVSRQKHHIWLWRWCSPYPDLGYLLIRPHTGALFERFSVVGWKALRHGEFLLKLLQLNFFYLCAPSLPIMSRDRNCNILKS